MADTIRIEVVYATRDRQVLMPLEIRAGSTVEEAIRSSGIQDRFTDPLGERATGIWGRLVDRGHVVVDGDRVEIYRPLLLDPMEARRELAKAQRLGSSS